MTRSVRDLTRCHSQRPIRRPLHNLHQRRRPLLLRHCQSMRLQLQWAPVRQDLSPRPMLSLGSWERLRPLSRTPERAAVPVSPEATSAVSWFVTKTAPAPADEHPPLTPKKSPSTVLATPVRLPSALRIPVPTSSAAARTHGIWSQYCQPRCRTLPARGLRPVVAVCHLPERHRRVCLLCNRRASRCSTRSCAELYATAQPSASGGDGSTGDVHEGDDGDAADVAAAASSSSRRTIRMTRATSATRRRPPPRANSAAFRMPTS